MVHFFVFQMHQAEGVPEDAGTPFALFTMSWYEDEPTSAVVITPKPEGNEVEVHNLREPSGVQVIALGDT